MTYSAGALVRINFLQDFTFLPDKIHMQKKYNVSVETR